MQKKVATIGKNIVIPLTKNLAQKYQKEITAIWNLIPLANHSEEDILKEGKKKQKYFGKWEHSLLVLNKDNDEVIAFIVGYERQAENNYLYPKDSLHLKSISVSKSYQNKGIGRELMKIWLRYNRRKGFLYLEGNFCFSVQTNGADWNKYVQNFYLSFGFKQTNTKKYPDKIDNIYFLE